MLNFVEMSKELLHVMQDDQCCTEIGADASIEWITSTLNKLLL